jgi:hypothetical protein
MTRDDAILFVAFQINDARDRRHATPDDVAEDDRLVGFQQLSETVFVIVRSQRRGVRLADEIARDLARDYLTEIGWFGEESLEAEFIF